MKKQYQSMNTQVHKMRKLFPLTPDHEFKYYMQATPVDKEKISRCPNCYTRYFTELGHINCSQGESQMGI